VLEVVLDFGFQNVHHEGDDPEDNVDDRVDEEVAELAAHAVVRAYDLRFGVRVLGPGRG
jgi:hypothetical protein